MSSLTNVFRRLTSQSKSLSEFTRPPYNEIALLGLALKTWFNPTLSGLEHVDSTRPALYVGNHTLLGHDVPPLMISLYLERDIFLRGVGDRIHFRVPFWGNLLHQYGAFEGTRESISELMQHQQHILIYPGGGREVFKNKGEAYQLIWKNRFGFIELALEHGYDIIPFAAIGGEEMFDVKYDSNDFKKSLLGKGLKKIDALKYMRNGEVFMPIATGYKGIPFIPRKQNLKYVFCPRIETKHIPRNQFDSAKIELRQQVADAINTALAAHGK